MENTKIYEGIDGEDIILIKKENGTEEEQENEFVKTKAEKNEMERTLEDDPSMEKSQTSD